MNAKTLNDAFCRAYLECPQCNGIHKTVKNMHEKGLYEVYDFWMNNRKNAYTQTVHERGYFNCLPEYIKSFIAERQKEIKQYEKEVLDWHEE